MNRFYALIACFLLGAAPANAALLQYQASGTVASVTGGATLTPGLPFTLSFEYDNSVVGVVNKGSTINGAPAETDYRIPSNFNLHVAGVNAVGIATKSDLTLFDTIGVGNVPEGILRITMQLQSYTAAGVAQPAGAAFILDFTRLGYLSPAELSPTGLSQFQPLNLTDFTPKLNVSSLAARYFYDGPNEWHMPQGIGPFGSSVTFQINSLTVVPEPSTIALLCSAGACAAVWKFRRRRAL